MATTLQNVIDRITLDYLNRTNLNSESVRAVQAAVRHYERQRFPWNEATSTLTAVTSQAYVTVPTDFLVLDHLEIQFQSANYLLAQQSFVDLLEMNAVQGTNNLPTDFAQRGGRLYLSSVPDSAYLLNCYYIQQLPALTAASMTSTNKWLSAAEDVIVYHATKLMWANVLRNTEEATKFMLLEQTALKELHGFRDQVLATRIRPTQF